MLRVIALAAMLAMAIPINALLAFDHNDCNAHGNYGRVDNLGHNFDVGDCHELADDIDSSVKSGFGPAETTGSTSGSVMVANSPSSVRKA